jgi:lysosomal acid lipase/cholesteryl ester hydrolase
VWLPNTRGTKYSFSHNHLSRDSREYWKFSIDEFAIFDVTAVVDHVLLTTGADKVDYIGFSQGSAQALIALSLDEELNHKVHRMIGLAPAMKPKSKSIIDQELGNPSVSYLIDTLSPLILYPIFGTKSFLPIAETLKNYSNPKINSFIIRKFVWFLFGWGTQNQGPKERQELLYHNLYGYTSIQNIVHWLNIIHKGQYHEYNPPNTWLMEIIYPLPKVYPFYPTKHIRVPIDLFCGSCDNLSDFDFMKNALPVHATFHEIEGYEHMVIFY